MSRTFVLDAAATDSRGRGSGRAAAGAEADDTARFDRVLSSVGGSASDAGAPGTTTAPATPVISATTVAEMVETRPLMVSFGLSERIPESPATATSIEAGGGTPETPSRGRSSSISGPTLAVSQASLGATLVGAAERTPSTSSSEAIDPPSDGKAPGRGTVSRKDSLMVEDDTDPVDQSAAAPLPSLALFGLIVAPRPQGGTTPAERVPAASGANNVAPASDGPVPLPSPSHPALDEQVASPLVAKVAIATAIAPFVERRLADQPVRPATAATADAGLPGQAVAASPVGPADRPVRSATDATVDAIRPEPAAAASPVKHDPVKDLSAPPAPKVAEARSDAVTRPNGSDAAPLLDAGAFARGPIRTIASAVVDLAADKIPEAPRTLVTATVAPAARTMTLQLSPAGLGTVDIRMHLVGQSLDLDLTVSDPRTLGLLDRDRDTLSTALGGQSFHLQSLVIQGPDASATTAGTPHANDDGKRQGSGAEQGPRDHQAGGRQEPSRPRDNGGNRPAGIAGPARGGGDQLYV